MKQHNLQSKSAFDTFSVSKKALSAFGEELAKLRRVKNLTMEKVASLTKIQARYLERLENGEFTKLPADVYIRGMLVKYAKIVDADPEELWRHFEEERSISASVSSTGKSRGIARRSGISDRLPQNRFLDASFFVLTPKLITIISLTLISFFIFGYLVYQFNFLVGPPTLSIFEPSEDILTTDKKIKLAGLVEIGAILTINGQPASVAGDGRFEEELALQPGVNVIEFLAKNHLGKIAVVKRMVVLKSPEAAADIGEINPENSPATSTNQ
jgi:transcriptional regulator with XRE-family HTH domain